MILWFIVWLLTAILYCNRVKIEKTRKTKDWKAKPITRSAYTHTDKFWYKPNFYITKAHSERYNDLFHKIK